MSTVESKVDPAAPDTTKFTFEELLETLGRDARKWADAFFQSVESPSIGQGHVTRGLVEDWFAKVIGAVDKTELVKKIGAVAQLRDSIEAREAALLKGEAALLEKQQAFDEALTQHEGAVADHQANVDAFSAQLAEFEDRVKKFDAMVAARGDTGGKPSKAKGKDAPPAEQLSGEGGDQHPPGNPEE